MRILLALNHRLAQVEAVVLCLCLTVMIVLAFFQVIMRNIFNAGYPWADILVRSLVLWVGFLGATVATKESQHLSIDVATKFIKGRLNTLIAILIHIFATMVSLVLCSAAYRFVVQEAEFGEKTIFDFPAWMMQGIIPVTFGLISFHFIVNIIIKLQTLLQPKSP